MARQIPDEDPLDPRAFIPNIEFYITNVCNLACSNCNRFNDYKFSGHQLWYEYQDRYIEWSRHVRLQRVTILGGEPLLNPSICDWVDGINNLWGKTVQILTNGTRLNQVSGLYDRISKFKEPKTGARNWIGISLHNPQDRESCFAEIKNFLRGTITYHHISDDADGANTFGATHAFIDSNGMRVSVWEYTQFYNAAVHRNSTDQLTLHNSDPEKAHSICGFVMYNCYHFVRAKLYKCGPVALFPEFDQQHRLDISDQDRELLNSYQALSADEFETCGQDFLANIDEVIPQCKFCPDQHQIIVLNATSKKLNSTSAFD